uniref:Uncharacterized protein n=1 Tax=Fusarium oxysporum (strain Fo5176) TaxID=660025 RepID=A0A0C4DJ55_FUSOF
MPTLLYWYISVLLVCCLPHIWDVRDGSSLWQLHSATPARRFKVTLVLATLKPQITALPQLPLREPRTRPRRLLQFSLTNLQLASVTFLEHHHIVRIWAIDDELLPPSGVISPFHRGDFPSSTLDTRYSALVIELQTEQFVNIAASVPLAPIGDPKASCNTSRLFRISVEKSLACSRLAFLSKGTDYYLRVILRECFPSAQTAWSNIGPGEILQHQCFSRTSQVSGRM